MKILFYVDEFSEFWNLLPLMKLMKENFDIAFGSVDHRIFNFAIQHNIPITNPFTSYFDLLVVNKMHYDGSRQMSEAYAKAGKQIVLVEHAGDGLLHLLDQLWGENINYFAAFAAMGKQTCKLLKNKFGDKIVLTGGPRLDRIIDAPKWDKKEIYDSLGVNEFWLVAIPPQNHSTPELEHLYFEVLPTLLDAKPVYKIHPRYPVEPYRKYGQLIIGDDTLIKDMTYEIINASKGIVTTMEPSFICVEASLLQKPVIGFGNLAPIKEVAPEIGFIDEDAYLSIRFKELCSTPNNHSYNDQQKQLINDFPHDGKNSERVAVLIEEVGAAAGIQ